VITYQADVRLRRPRVVLAPEAILPSAAARSEWHPWAQMATALADASTTLHQPGLLGPAVADTAIFTPHLLTATGPDNLWGPAPVDSSQIAYGAGARVLALLAVATATNSAGLRQLAGIAAGWFFGQNPADTATYNPATGATDDGINANGTGSPCQESCPQPRPG
jgi:hypothetical protein